MARKTAKQKALERAERDLFSVSLDLDLIIDFKLLNISEDLKEEGETIKAAEVDNLKIAAKALRKACETMRRRWEHEKQI